MADVLAVLPTIGANWGLAREAIKTWGRETAVPADLLVVLDDPGHPNAHGHMDTLRALTPGWGTPFLHANPSRVGLVAAYNEGFKWFRSSTYRYLMLLEENVHVTPGYDLVMRKVLEAHPKFGWVACGQHENPGAPFTSLCSLMTRDCAEAVEGMDPVFSPCHFDDGDLYMRALQKGFRPHGVPHLIHHPESRTAREGSYAIDIQKLKEKQAIFAERWGIPDMIWNLVPVHAACRECRKGTVFG